jgi:hypothetical protein
MSQTIVTFPSDQELIERLEKELTDPTERAYVWRLTPRFCRHVLANHFRRNRKESGSKIKRYAADMARDGWALNGEPVKFTKLGQLGDGQNRFKGCVRSGTPFTTFVAFGIADEHFFTMDRGKARTAADVLHLEGVAHSELIASAMRWAELVITNSVKRRFSYEPAEILEMWRNKQDGHSGVEDFIDEARQIHRITDEPRAVIMAMLYLFNKVEPDFTPDFAAAWANSSRDPVRWSAIKSMEDTFAEVKAHSRHRNRERNRRIGGTITGRIHDVVRVAMIINCFLRSKRGERGLRGSLDWTLEDTFPQIPGLVYRPPLGQPNVVQLR